MAHIRSSRRARCKGGLPIRHPLGNGGAEPGYRIAQRAADRGPATWAVRELCDLAANSYGLTMLRAATNARQCGIAGRTGPLRVRRHRGETALCHSGLSYLRRPAASARCASTTARRLRTPNSSCPGRSCGNWPGTHQASHPGAAQMLCASTQVSRTLYAALPPPWSHHPSPAAPGQLPTGPAPHTGPEWFPPLRRRAGSCDGR